MDIQEEQLREFVKAGVHIGHRKSRRHPRMMPFIFGLRGNTEIIDVSKTAEAIDAAAAFLSIAAESGKTIMFVGTRPSLAELTKEMASAVKSPYVTVRWIGGTLTNWGVIGKRLDAFRDLVAAEMSGELKEKYTKAEHVRFQRKIAKLTAELGGIKEMTILPDILVISSLRTNKLAAVEAQKKGILTVAIVDTDSDPKLVDYPIPANDDALPSVKLILGRLRDAIAAGKGKAPKPKAEEEAKDGDAKAETGTTNNKQPAASESASGGDNEEKPEKKEETVKAEKKEPAKEASEPTG